MSEHQNLEEKVAHADHGSEHASSAHGPDHKEGGLETKVNSVIDEFFKIDGADFLKVAAMSAAAIGITSLFVPGALLSWSTTLGSYLVAKYFLIGNSMDKNEIQSEIQVANTMLSVLAPLYGYLHSLKSIVAKELFGFGVMVPGITLVYTGVNAIIQKYSLGEGIKNIGGAISEAATAIKEHYVESLKTVYKWMSIPLAVVYAGVTPLKWQIPATSIMRTIFRYVLGKGQIDRANQKNHKDNESPHYTPSPPTGPKPAPIPQAAHA